MKLRNYESKFALYVLSFIFIVCFLIFIFFLILNKHFSYITYTGVVSSENVIFMVKESEAKYFYNNGVLLCDAKKKKFTIKKVYKNILTKKNTKYHQIIVNFNFSNKYKDNDALNISLKKKKESLISIFKTIWKEE